MKTEQPAYFCCKKMQETLQYKDAAFRSARKNLIAVHAGYTEMQHKDFSKIMKKVIKERKKSKNQDITIHPPIPEKDLYDPATEKTIRVEMNEVISFCPFCGQKLSAK